MGIVPATRAIQQSILPAIDTGTFYRITTKAQEIFEVAFSAIGTASSKRFDWDFRNPTRERGTHEGRPSKCRNFIPHLRFGLG